MKLRLIPRRLLTNAIDFVFPPLCIFCTERRAPDNRWLCPACIDKLNANHTARDACPRCSQNRARTACTCDLVWDHPFERIFSCLDFDERVQKIVHEMKYGGAKRLAFDMGTLCAPWIPAEFLADVDAWTVTPLHFLRRMRRGYNQADHLARGILRAAGIGAPYLPGALVRKRHTRTQTALDKNQRIANLKGAFAVPPSKGALVKGRRLILVDDVVTTGATTGFCAEALLAAGCREVRVLSLARD